MLNLCNGNALVLHFSPTLEMLEMHENKAFNTLQKRLLKQNRKTMQNAILHIGTMIAYNKNADKRKLKKMHLL